jgi:hypothetical protein
MFLSPFLNAIALYFGLVIPLFFMSYRQLSFPQLFFLLHFWFNFISAVAVNLFFSPFTTCSSCHPFSFLLVYFVSSSLNPSLLLLTYSRVSSWRWRSYFYQFVWGRAAEAQFMLLFQFFLCACLMPVIRDSFSPAAQQCWTVSLALNSNYNSYDLRCSPSSLT